MASLIITNAAQQVAINAFTDLINVGGAGTIELYAGATLLGTLAFSVDAFADADASGVATANAITGDSSADAPGIADSAIIKSGAGTQVFSCDVGIASDEPTIVLDDKDIREGGTINITSFTLTMPSGA